MAASLRRSLWIYQTPKLEASDKFELYPQIHWEHLDWGSGPPSTSAALGQPIISCVAFQQFSHCAELGGQYFLPFFNDHYSLPCGLANQWEFLSIFNFKLRNSGSGCIWQVSILEVAWSSQNLTMTMCKMIFSKSICYSAMGAAPEYYCFFFFGNYQWKTFGTRP